MQTPLWLQAGLWGWLAGAALLVGAALGWYMRVSPRAVASIMAFGAGVLISAMAFDLMDEAWHRGGLVPATGGFLAGALLFTGANAILDRLGGKHRKRSGTGANAAPESGGAGLAIAVGALIDGIPESVVIGASLVEGGRVSLVAVIAIFLSNLPEGLSSAAGLKKTGRSAAYVFGLWGAIALVSGLASLLGFVAAQGLSPALVATIVALAAGAILAMLVDTMIPEAFSEAHAYAGLITVTGFLVAFWLSKTFA